jgi:hypothetical protein
MNDRVVASMHSSGVQLELTALVWRRNSLSVLANVCAAVVDEILRPKRAEPFDQLEPSVRRRGSRAVFRPRGQRFSNRPPRN